MTERSASDLASAIAALRPDVIHTLGMQPGGYLYLEARRQMGGAISPLGCFVSGQ